MTLAIDPGVSGGIAIGLDYPMLFNMPETAHDLAELIKDHAIERAFVEEVGGFIGKEQPGSRMFTFGMNAGVIKGILAALAIPTVYVRPQKWQAALGLGTSNGLDKNKWKNKLKSRAQQLYPQHKVTLATADALLIWHAAVTSKVTA